MKKFTLFTRLLPALLLACALLAAPQGIRAQGPDHPILWNVPETDYLKFYIFQVV